HIPVLHTGGWFDNVKPDQMRDYDTLMARPDVAGLQYLEMNSTDHENYFLELVPIGPGDDHDSNEDALARMLPRYLGSALDFFDVFLKGGANDIPRVRWHQGNDGWRTAPSWPPPGARELRLHLGSADLALSGAEGGRLADARADDDHGALGARPGQSRPIDRRGSVRLPAGAPGRAHR
ncbi:MAG: peptidase S15, partial [Actinomycetota bacterium]|nr:peptidase S15 [Actinomycetota bacterium]